MGGIRTLLSTPVQQGAEATQFYVTRTKHILGHPTWSVFLEQNDQFLCSAKVRAGPLHLVPFPHCDVCLQKRSGKSSSNYLITLDADHSERKSRMNIGKLRANLVRSPLSRVLLTQELQRTLRPSFAGGIHVHRV